MIIFYRMQTKYLNPVLEAFNQCILPLSTGGGDGIEVRAHALQVQVVEHGSLGELGELSVARINRHRSVLICLRTLVEAVYALDDIGAKPEGHLPRREQGAHSLVHVLFLVCGIEHRYAEFTLMIISSPQGLYAGTTLSHHFGQTKRTTRQEERSDVPGAFHCSSESVKLRNPPVRTMSW